jgi:lysophospholipase L1-like esterase
MDLSNLKINFLGDSITYGAYATSEEKSYIGLLRKRYPDAVIRNYSVGGSCISDKCLWGVPSFNEREAEMDPDADLVVVFGGSNDYCCCAPLGEKTDRTEGTFYGACYSLFEKLLRRYHGKTIVVVTPLHRLDEDGTICEGRPMLAPLSDYVSVLKEVAEYFAFPVIDLFATSGLQPNIDFIREIYTTDGLHPNDAGHALLMRKMDGALRDVY